MIRNKPNRVHALHAGFSTSSSSKSKSLNPSSFTIPDSSSPCLCGSTKKYSECCESVHKNVGSATSPGSLIRSRYSAYTTNNAEFIIASTSKKSPDYISYVVESPSVERGLKNWAKQIRRNMIVEYAYVKCEIIEELYSSPTQVEVKFRHLAIRKADNIMFPVEETSLLVLEDDKWLYVSGNVQRPPPEVSQHMMQEWPGSVGLKLKGNLYHDEEEEEKGKDAK